LRTTPPRENGGNVDIKQLTAGAVVLLPVFVPGALFSIGDVHYAQGDSEAVGTAIEMRGRVTVSFGLRPGRAPSLGAGGMQFERPSWEPPEPRGRFHATTGICTRRTGENAFEDLTLAATNALLAMIRYLRDRGFTDDQAYAICSVAVDLRISQVVNYPNVLVTALLPLGIFDEVG
jgi:formamidase